MKRNSGKNRGKRTREKMSTKIRKRRRGAEEKEGRKLRRRKRGGGNGEVWR
jgi:hypothetical protein